MKTGARAFTLVELLVLIGIVFIVLALIPMHPPGTKRKAQRISCVNNLRQVGIALRSYAEDHNSAFPWMVSTNEGGTREMAGSDAVFAHFAVASNDIVMPKILHCPADKSRPRAESFHAFDNTALSYFVSLDTKYSTNAPQAVLTGDRNLWGGTSLSPHLRLVKTSDQLRWTKDLHQNVGNIGLADGSVQQVTPASLTRHFGGMTNMTIRLAIP